MARLPTAAELSGPVLRNTGMPQVADQTGFARGLTNFGADVADIGATFEKQRGTADIANAEADFTNAVLSGERDIENTNDYGNYQKNFDVVSKAALDSASKHIGNATFRQNWIATKQEEIARRRQAIADKANTGAREGMRVNLSTAIEKDQNLYTDPATPEPDKQAAFQRINDSITSAEKTGLLDPIMAEKWRQTYRDGSILKEAELRVLNDPSFRQSVLRGDQPASNDLVNAVIGVESDGRYDKVSDAGAAGQMQVMPGTGAEIARDIGDPNFPADGTEAQQQAYLKNPDISRKYGTFYLEKMINRYNGDVDAALVAYNGGPERADAWVKSGKNDGVLPKETSDYYKKVRTRLGGTFSAGDVDTAKSFLKTRTDKDASHIEGLNGGFSVKLSRLIQSAPPEIKDKLGVYSGARTPERQAQIIADNMGRFGLDRAAWESDVRSMGPKEAGEKWAADFRRTGMSREYGKPGYSFHQHGTAADLSYNGASLAQAPKEVVDWLHSNAGAYGLKFPLANENWHIEDAGTRAGGGALRSGAYADLTPDQRQSLYEVAQRKQTQDDTAANALYKQRQTAEKDNYSLLIANNDPSLTRSQILQNTVLDNGDKAVLLKQYDEAAKEGMAVGQAMPLFSNGQLGMVVDPYSEQGRKLVNGMANTLAKTIQPEQQQAVMEDLARQSGYVPQPYFNGIRSGLASGDVQSVAGAAQAAVRINQINPNILGRSTDGNKVQDAATSFQYYTQNMGLTPEQAAQKLIDASDPAKVREREALLKSKPIADGLKNLSASDVTKAMGSSWGTDVGAPQTEELRRVGVNPDAEAAIIGDFRRYVEEAVTETGDLDLAKSVAGERFKRVYGTSQFSPVGGDVIMRYPVEKAYPADPSGSHEWVKAQAIEALKGEGVDAGNVYLMPMPNGQTERDIQTGRPARYQIFYEDKDGALQQFNLPFYGDAKAAMEGFSKAKADVRSGYERGMIENRAGAIEDAASADAIRAARSEAEQQYRDYPEQYRAQMVREAERKAMNDAAR